MTEPLFIDAALVIPADELSWTSVRASGPGGQNVNKVASKVELRFDAVRSAVLSDAVRSRLFVLAASRIDADGQVVVTSQLTRDRARNLADARAKLAELLWRAAHPPKKRRATRPSLASKRARLEDKRRRGDKKKMRRAVD